MYKQIKEEVSMQAAAERYGVRVNRSGFACCPFHQEKTASLKIYEASFYCFGCGAGGDVITFAAKLYGLTNAQAALRLNEDFGLCLTVKKAPAAASAYLRKKAKEEQQRRDFRREYLKKCEEFYTLHRALSAAEGFHCAAIMSRLEYLDYYFENTHWR